MSDLLRILGERGFVHQTTEEELLEELLRSDELVTAYVGIDPTASSCHVGTFLPIMMMIHLQRAGCRPILVVGGGTGRIGDPSGKTEMRKLLGEDDVESNVQAIRTQISRYLDLGDPDDPAVLSENKGIVVNNADWILPLNYVEFLRDIGRHFSVNRMLTAESVKLRLASDSGLSFLEFNYSLLQAYDFLVLNRRFGCQLQVGGSDQWGNIVAGVDLIRRVEGKQAHGITFPLIMTASGNKMGKTEAGAVWLDRERTSPYDYYQFWINTDDRDVGRFLRLFTLLSIEEIEGLERLQGADIRRAKEVLAFEATSLAHGKEEAEKAREAAKSLFYGAASGGDSVPAYTVPEEQLAAGIPAYQLFHECGLCESKGAARRMARQGGLYVNGTAVSEEHFITADDLQGDGVLLRAGKKKHRKILVG